MTGYAFHPEAKDDINDIWEYIAADNPAGADRVTAEIEDALDNLVSFPGFGHRRPDLTSRPLRFIVVREYLMPMRRTKNRYGLSQSCTDAAARVLCRQFSEAESNQPILKMPTFENFS